ncbi:ABC transporter substrate-binding protein [Roseomonas sp. BN140053]|uniref:ABC transporter substrate-binding protein n=1 Tax=Roseomonas sp. BN140053 TaxID=3391898 RepID=UPI0039E76243
MTTLTRRGLAPLLAAPALLALPFGRVARAATPRDSLVIVREISSIADWDPAVSQILDVQEINGDLYDRLVGYDPRVANAPLGPMLAESWTVSPDGKQFTFRLREGAKFHSGNPVTAEDVAYSFRRLLLLEREPSSSMLQLGFTKENIAEGARAADPRTFVLTLGEQFAPSYVLALLSAAPFSVLDAKLLQANEQNGDFGSRWVSRRTGTEPSAGSGAYRIATYRASDILILERNDAWWRFRPALRRVIFRHVPEAGTQRLLLERGDADVAFNLTAPDAEALGAGVAGVRVESKPSRRLMYFGFNTLTKPFDDPRVREAMKWLIDYQGMERTVMRNLGRVHQNFVASGWLGAVQDNPYKLDVPRAKALLAEAGHADGFSFRFTAYNSKPEMDQATSFQSTAAQAGVRVEVQNMPPSQSIPLYRDRRVEALQLSFYGGYGDPHATASKFAYNPAALPGADPNSRWPSELAWRLGWAPADLSRRVLEATRELDEAKRGALYESLQRDARAQSPFAFLFQATLAMGMRSEVKDYRYGTRGTDTSFAAVSKG